MFRELSRRIGKERVVWRFDPVLATKNCGVDELLRRVQYIGDRLAPFTERLVFSFIDIARYASVARHTAPHGIRELSGEEMDAFAAGLSRLNRDWGLALATCAEERDLSAYGIGKNRCIDAGLLARLAPDDAELAACLRQNPKKDPGQRKECGCSAAKDIGMYGTCPNACVYCYANRSPEFAQENFARHRLAPGRELITGEVVPGKREETAGPGQARLA